MKIFTRSLLSLFCSITPTLHALEAFHGPQSASMAGTGLAGLEGSEGALVNPAQVALERGYSMDFFYHDGDLLDGQHREGMGLGAVDNGGDVVFPGALHYSRLRDTGRGPEPTDRQLVHFAIGEMVKPGLAFGLSGYQLTDQMRAYPKYTQWNYSIGSLWMITDQVGVAYVLNNIAHPSGKVPLTLREPLQQGLGFYSVIAEIASVRLDLSRNETNNPSKKLAYAVGFESMSGAFAILRAGFRRDEQQDQRYMTLGLCFNGPRLKFDYAYEKSLEGARGALHSVDLRLPF